MNLNEDITTASMGEDTPLIPENATRVKGVVRQSCAVAAACLATLSFGLVLGYSSPALPAIKSEGILTEEQATWYGSLTTLGAMLGGPLGGILADSLGRKTATMLCGSPFLVGWLLNIITENVWMLYLGRLTTGLAVGMSSLCVPVYIAEVSAPALRGRFGFCFQVCVTGGILLVYVLGLWVEWRWLTVACACIPALMVLCLLLVPETPRWLIRNGQRQRAMDSLKWLRHAHSEREISQEWVELDGGLASSTVESKFVLRDLLAPTLYKPFLLSVALMFFQQFSGINAIIFYTNDIFKSAGFEGDSGTPTVVIGALQVIVTVLSALVVDRAGRRPMLIISGTLMTVSCLTFGLYYYLDSPSLSWLSLASLALYIAAFSVGWGPLPWVAMAELLPPKGYGFTSGISTATNWAVAFIITKEFVAMENAMTKYGTFWFFGGICALGVAFVSFLLPETKGKSLQDIALSFETGR